MSNKERFDTEKGGNTEMLRAAPVSANATGVDKENNIIKGYIVAQLGAFKTGRGEFTQQSLAQIAKLMNSAPDGVPVNYGHQSDPGSGQTLDAFLGMSKNARVDGNAVRADLHFLPDSTGRVEKLMHRAEHAPSSFGSSLVLQADKQFRLDNRGHRKTDTLGNPLPPVWMPLAIMGSDVVATGDATNGFLAPEPAEQLADQDWLFWWENEQRKAGAA